MVTIIYRWYNKLLSTRLSILGFGGTFALMGCPDSDEELDSMEALYGSPIPDYRVKVEPNHLFFIGDDK